MATTTPNFGWPVPTSTDLVKDGATAIEALGDSIDASLLDLKGGTTGQVLSKTTGTDMDFTWVTTDDANAIQNAIVNAKGDIIGASANDVPAITSVGANFTVLSAQSGQATGLQWAGATTSYTPTWTADGTAPSLGNGTLFGNYIRYGALCQVRMFFQAGSTTTFGTFGWNFSLPFTPLGGNYGVPGNVYVEDNAVAGYRAQTYINNQFYMQTTATNAKVGATAPFTWATGDYFNTQFIYEVA